MLQRITVYLVAAKISLNAKLWIEKVTKHNKQKFLVRRVKDFEDKSRLILPRSLSDKVDDDVWVRVLNPTLEQKKVYKNARIACAENIEKFLRIQNNPDNNTKNRD